MTKAKSTKPNVEYIREWLEDYKASFGVAIPSAGLPTSHVISNVEWLLAENESLKADVELKASIARTAIANQEGMEKELERMEAERDKLLEVIREYRFAETRLDHRFCRKWKGPNNPSDDRCPTCIKADELLLRKEK